MIVLPSGEGQAVAAARGRPGLPTCEDAEQARHLANDLARPSGWRGPTAGQLWQERQRLTAEERATFLATVDSRRLESRQVLNFSPDELLDHYAQEPSIAARSAMPWSNRGCWPLSRAASRARHRHLQRHSPPW